MENSYKIYLSIVDEYLNSSFTDLALLLRGEWGSGKTYFIQNVLSNHIKSNHKDKSLLYISLNGIANPNDIYHRMLANYLGDAKWKYYSYGAAETIAKIGANYFGLKSNSGFSKLKKELIKNGFPKLDNKILCFDDLERIDEKISYQELFGFINNDFLEQKGIKVIFVSHSEKIKDPEYPDVKEKYIYKDILFTPDINEVFDNLITIFEGKKQYCDYLIEQKNKILSLIFNNDELNIRTLKYFFDSYQRIFDACPKDVSESIKLSVLLFTFYCTYEYKLGTFDSKKTADNIIVQDNMGELLVEKLTSRNTNKMKIMDVKYSQNNSEPKKVEEPPNKIEIYNKYYADYYDDFQYYSSILTYITDGYLDLELLEEEIKAVSNDNEPEHIVRFKELRNYKSLTDEKFTKVITEVVEYVKSGLYDIYELPLLENYLIYFQTEGLLSENIEKLLNDALKLGIEDFEYDFIKYNSFKHSGFDNSSEKFIIFDKIIKEVDKVIERENKKEIIKLISSIFNNEILNKVYYTKFIDKPIFSNLSAKDLLNDIKKSSNKSLTLFRELLQSHFEDPYFSQNKKTEKSVLIELMNGMKNYASKLNSKSLKRHLIVQIFDLVESKLS